MKKNPPNPQSSSQSSFQSRSSSRSSPQSNHMEPAHPYNHPTISKKNHLEVGHLEKGHPEENHLEETNPPTCPPRRKATLPTSLNEDPPEVNHLEVGHPEENHLEETDQPTHSLWRKTSHPPTHPRILRKASSQSSSQISPWSSRQSRQTDPAYPCHTWNQPRRRTT